MLLKGIGTINSTTKGISEDHSLEFLVECVLEGRVGSRVKVFEFAVLCPYKEGADGGQRRDSSPLQQF